MIAVLMTQQVTGLLNDYLAILSTLRFFQELVQIYGLQSYAIHLKNARLIEMGWNVIRFMPYQIKDDIDWCVNTIQSKITSR